MVREGYKQTEVGIIPEDWEVYPLAKLASQPIQNGIFVNPLKKGRGCKLINVSDLYSSIPINLEDLEFFDADQSEIKRFGVSRGDVFFTRSSLTPDGIAHCNIYDGTENKVVFDCHLIRFRPNANVIVPKFFFRYCATSVARKYLVTHSKTTTMTTIDQGVISKLSIPLPSLLEQRSIAQALSDVDALIATLDKLIAKKRHLKIAAMQQLLTGKKRLPGFGEGQGYKESVIGVIPEDWQTCTLGDAVNFFDGKRKPIREGERAKMRGIYPYYGASGIVDYVNDYLFDEDLILLGEDGENILSRSTRLAFRVSGKIWVNNHAHVLKPKPNFDINFLTEYLESLDYSLYNSGTAQPKLNQQTCQRISVVQPSEKEQCVIATILSNMDAEIAALETRLAKTQAIKQGMMQELLTGRTRLV